VNGWNFTNQQPVVDAHGTVTPRMADGKFSVQAQIVKGVNQQYWPQNLAPVSDQSLTVDARRVSGPVSAFYGLMFRRDAAGSFYLFQVRDDQLFSVSLYQNQWISLSDWTRSDAIRPNQPNRLNVTAIGSHFTFAINNQPLGYIDDSRLSSGAPGVFFNMDPGQAVFEFSNFELRTP
jgi:hypothetical protein